MLTVSFDPFPDLTTERLKLRKLTNDDAAALFQLRSNPQVMQYIDRPRPASVEDVMPLMEMMANGLENNESITWAICQKESPLDLIGTIVLWHFQKEHYRAEIGYMLHPSHHGKKLMSEAMAVVIDYGFNTLKLHSIEAVVNPYNKASIRLLEKFGFVREAYFRENYFFDGRFLDSAVYSLIKNIR